MGLESGHTAAVICPYGSSSSTLDQIVMGRLGSESEQERKKERTKKHVARVILHGSTSAILVTIQAMRKIYCIDYGVSHFCPSHVHCGPGFRLKSPVGQEFRLFEAMVGMVDKMGRIIKKQMFQVGVMWRSSFLSEGLKLPKKLGLLRTSPCKKCCHVGSHVIFSFMLEVFH